LELLDLSLSLARDKIYGANFSPTQNGAKGFSFLRRVFFLVPNFRTWKLLPGRETAVQN
jgi:hypothetical protein